MAHFYDTFNLILGLTVLVSIILKRAAKIFLQVWNNVRVSK